VESVLDRSLTDDEWSRFESISDLVQERTKLLPEAGEQVVFLFEDFETYEEKSWEKVMTKDGVKEILSAARDTLADLEEWDHASIEKSLRGMIESMGIGVGKALQPIRVAVTGTSVSPPLFECLAALGRDKSMQRLDRAMALL